MKERIIKLINRVKINKDVRLFIMIMVENVKFIIYVRLQSYRFIDIVIDKFFVFKKVKYLEIFRYLRKEDFYV